MSEQQSSADSEQQTEALRSLLKIAHYSPASTVQPVAIARDTLTKLVGTWQQGCLDEQPVCTEPQSASLAVDRDLLRRVLGYARNATCPFSGQPEVDNWHSRSDADCRYLDALLSVPAEPQSQAVSDEAGS